jgi:hypothetical protein
VAPFQVGDKVIGNDKASLYTLTRPGTTWYVLEVRGPGCITVGYRPSDIPQTGYQVDPTCFDFLSRGIENGAESPETTKLNKEHEEVYLSDEVKYIKLSADEKVLHEAGMISLDGKVTSEGWELLKQEVLNANKAAMVKLATEINANRKARKAAATTD